MNDDAISRQAAIDAICEHGTDLERRGVTVIAVVYHKQATVDLLERLPSAERRGRWITYKRHVQGSPYIAFGEDGKPFIQHHQIEVTRYKCSLCGVVEDVNTPFCSECGARMEVE